MDVHMGEGTLQKTISEKQTDKTNRWTKRKEALWNKNNRIFLQKAKGKILNRNQKNRHYSPYGNFNL